MRVEIAKIILRTLLIEIVELLRNVNDFRLRQILRNKLIELTGTVRKLKIILIQ